MKKARASRKDPSHRPDDVLAARVQRGPKQPQPAGRTPPDLADAPARATKAYDEVDRMSRHLVGLSTAMRLRMRAGLVDRGHDLRASTAQVIPNLPPNGLRISELAARLRLTLQRTGQLVSELEEVGYLERVADPTDGRAKRVVFTARGMRLVRDIDEIMQESTNAFAKALGRERFQTLCGLLSELDIAINGADAPVRVVGSETP